MIRYTLACLDHHEFEVWFSSSAAFEAQREDGLLACPVCGSTAVDRALMAPAVSTARKKEARVRRETAEPGDSVRLAANVADDQPPPRKEVVKALRKLRKQLTQNADYVGDRFAEEARRIHYEETEKRAIYGEATREDAHEMAEEGIAFHPLPSLPEDHN